MHEFPRKPVAIAAGTLLLASGTGVAGRLAIMRHIKRRCGSAWARKVNVASLALAAGAGVFGLYRAGRQYNGVRSLQLRCCKEAQAQVSQSAL